MINTKYEFLAALEKELERYGVVDKDDILADFEQHFSDSKKQGYTDAEVCERLGSITEIAKQYAAEEIYPVAAVEPIKKPDNENANINSEKISEPVKSEAEKTAEDSTTENEDGSIIFSRDFNSDFNDVRINVTVAKTVITCSPDGITRVRYNNNRPGMRFTAELIGTTLEINEKSRGFSFWLFGFTNHRSELRVELPKKIYNSLNFSTVSGGAELCGLRSVYLNVNSTSGTIDIKAHAEDIDLSTTSGNLTLENCTNLPTKSFKLNSTSGRSNIYGIKPVNYSLNAVSGHFEITDWSGSGKINLTSGHANMRFAEWNGGLDVSIVSGWVNVALPQNGGVNLNMSKISGHVKYELGGDVGRCVKNGQYSFGGVDRQNAYVSLTSGHVDFNY